ncbi:hypothetical protein HYV50_03895 [Candidatus Pacearchaeota archaeon]|nr:hypothetical protein [Candidatus Pacearchaeota archaeon]
MGEAKYIISAYGIIGIILIILTELNFFIKIQPFEKIYFPIVWLGYILFVDGLTYKIRGKSFVKNNLPSLVGMFVISAPFWKIFEYINLRLGNWHYIGTEYFGRYDDLFAFISFSTVIPAFFITLQLFKPEIEKSIPEKKLSKKSFGVILLTGLVSFILMLTLPKYLFPLEWISLFLIFDSINYYNKQPSLIYALNTGQNKLIKNIAITSLTLGFLWEFWNYWASVKWVYNVPFADFLKIFEMPALGYLGYIPFGFEIFSFYFFVRWLFKKNLNL